MFHSHVKGWLTIPVLLLQFKTLVASSERIWLRWRWHLSLPSLESPPALASGTERIQMGIRSRNPDLGGQAIA